MKLRLRGNTLRLRLTRGEVDAIGRGEAVEEKTELPDGSAFTYRLAVGDQYDARSSGLGMEIEVPGAAGVSWAESEVEVGINGADPVQIGPLAVLIEKDFTCLAPREGEEEIDTFPNPNAA